MGNIIQCCQSLSHYLKCKDASGQSEPENSPLLSGEESESESLSLPENLDDDLLTVSTVCGTSQTLEPQNFLFPDIILSSNPGGDGTLVEPMVCLLVCEEEEDGGPEWSNRRRYREFSEVETQTEVETLIGMGVQTQTESQTPTKTLMCHIETEVRITTSGENKKGMVVDAMDDREIVRQEQKRCSEIVRETPAGTQKKKMEWFDVDDFVEIEAEWTMDGKNRPSVRDTDQDPEAGQLRKSLTCEELTTTSGANHKHTNEEENVFKMQQSTDISWTEQHLLRLQENIKDEEESSESETTAVILTEHNLHHMKGKTLASDSEKTVKPSVQNNDLLNNFDPTMCDVSRTRQRGPEDEQTVQEPGESDQKVNESDLNKRPSEASILNRHHNPHQENLHPPERDEDDNKTAVCQVLDLETVQSQVEEDEDGDQMKNLALFSADRLTTLHINAPEGQTEKIPVDDSPEQPECDESKHADIPEIPDLQDEHLTVRIQPPRTESFALQVSGQLLVTELHQVLMEHQSTCHCTCFSLQLGGTTLDSLTKLRCIQGIEDGPLIKVVEESYSALDARLHLRHVRDLMRSLDPADAYNGVNCSSLSFLTFYTGGEKDGESVGSRRASKGEFGEFRPPEYILPGCRDPPLTPLQPLRQDRKPLQCLRVLTMSSWNPPPGNRKMHGDLMYLDVLSMEDKEFNITSSTRGFYLNQSTSFNFNPKPAVPKIFCHSLVELLSQVSPAFRKTFSVLQKKRVQLHPCEQITTPFQVFTWTAHQEDHTLNCVRAEEEETPTSRMGRDAHTAGQSRDWNEELQACRDLKRNSFQERLQRDRSIFKINSDFVKAATRGAVAVIDGNAMPLNPGEVPHMQMFIWNNLFFSLGFDISEHYRPLGGNTAAHAAATCDLRGVQAYTSVDIEGLYTLGTAVVDYRGIRVIAQTVVPGILEKNQEQSVVYGSNDYGKTVFTHPKFVHLLDQTTKSLRIQRHQVLDHNNSPVELCSGIETKGILGNDGRPYILDLLRTFPPDLNFQFSETKESTKEVPELCRSFGYPRPHCHSLASLRPELIEAFVQNRHKLYVKTVSQNLIHLEEQQESTEQREEPTSTTADMEVQRRNVIMKACEAVGSVSNSCFDIRFNPDVYSPGVRFSSECSAEVQRQRLLLWDAAAFLLSDQIPAVLRGCLDLTAEPMDGGTLTSVLHQQGVNVRYLGTLLRELDRMEERGRLSHIQRICVGEVIIRSAKHIFRSYLQDVEPAAFSAAVSHFLNCLLSSSSSFPDSGQDELLSRRRSRRRRSQGSRVASLTESLWARLSPSELWCRIRTEAGEYYHYTVDSESMDDVMEKHSLQRISLLREFAIMTGIQVQLRDYMFESRHRPVFAEEDVVNMFPVVKHLKPKGTEATRLVQQAQVAIQQGLLRDGYELMSQALTLFSSVCGDLHEDVSLCLRLLARLSYILGEYVDAISRQEKTVLISERVQGIDHPQTIQDYTHLGLYCFAGDRRSTSLQLLYRARYLMLLVTGEDHPHVALLDSMLGLVLHSLTEHKLSLKFLQNALILTSKYHGATSLRNAHSHHLLATAYESQGEFQSALHYEKEAHSIYTNEVGEAHESTMESSEYMKSLINQAVSLSKPFNYTDGQTPCVQPPKFSTPSPPTILQQLNLTCGITLTPLR